MTDRELMQQALEALQYASDETKPENLYGCDCLICKTINALRDRLAQPNQEPVGWFGYDTGVRVWFETNKGDDDSIPLYKAPRKWVGLTDEEINSIPDCEYMDFYKAINAKLKEKNT